VVPGETGGYQKASWKALTSKRPLYVKQEEEDSLQKRSDRNENEKNGNNTKHRAV